MVSKLHRAGQKTIQKLYKNNQIVTRPTKSHQMYTRRHKCLPRDRLSIISAIHAASRRPTWHTRDTRRSNMPSDRPTNIEGAFKFPHDMQNTHASATRFTEIPSKQTKIRKCTLQFHRLFRMLQKSVFQVPRDHPNGIQVVCCLVKVPSTWPKIGSKFVKVACKRPTGSQCLHPNEANK